MTVKYDVDLGIDYDLVDMIPYVPAGGKVTTSNASTTVKWRPENPPTSDGTASKESATDLTAPPTIDVEKTATNQAAATETSTENSYPVSQVVPDITPIAADQTCRHVS